MKRWKAEAIRVLILAGLFAGAFAVAPIGCENYTPEQITANAAAISSVVTTTGQVVTPLVLNLENGQKVKAQKAKVITAKATATPTP